MDVLLAQSSNSNADTIALVVNFMFGAAIALVHMRLKWSEYRRAELSPLSAPLWFALFTLFWPFVVVYWIWSLLGAFIVRLVRGHAHTHA